MKSLLTILAHPVASARDIFMKSMFVRYVFSGGTAAAIDVGVLYVLNTGFGMYYLYAASIALTVSFFARFFLQKFVTFKDDTQGEQGRQFAYYTILYVASLLATNALLYFFVDLMHLPIVVSQVTAILMIACACYFIYRLFIFTKKPQA